MIIIGITGHRDIVETKKLKQDITKLFENLQSQNQETKLLSPLADGADRFVADVYLEVFKDKAKLVVPMPFDQERYMEDFDSTSKEEFLEYLKMADEVFEVKNSQECHYKSVEGRGVVSQRVEGSCHKYKVFNSSKALSNWYLSFSALTLSKTSIITPIYSI